MDGKSKLRNLVITALQQNLISEKEVEQISQLGEKLSDEALIAEIMRLNLLPQKVLESALDAGQDNKPDIPDSTQKSDEKISRDKSMYLPLAGQEADLLLKKMAGGSFRLPEPIRFHHFQHYFIYKIIRAGVMSDIYEGFDQELHRRVALKVLKESLDSGRRERFQREAHIVARLQHPHIVKILTPGKDLVLDSQKPQDFLVMEYIDGVSLSVWLARQQESIKSAEEWDKMFHAIAEIFQKVAEALGYVHDQGVLHRDIKPSNIMIEKNGEPKILDFGIAQFSTWLFVPDDFRDASNWIEKLKIGSDAVSAYLKSRLPSELQSQIAAWEPQQTIPDDFLERLVPAMNGLLQTWFYDSVAFQNIPLRSQTKKKLRPDLKDQDLVHFNRMLLEDAYPHQFLASYNTKTGALMGTPDYMSPEQVRNETLTPATDIYSLGVTLYQALCGRKPFVGKEWQVLQQIQNPTLIPDPPRTFIPQIPSNLEAICLKCMEKQPDRRYPTAHALADDLDNFLHNRPIQASSRTRWTFVLGHKGSFGVVILILWILLAGALVFGSIEFHIDPTALWVLWILPSFAIVSFYLWQQYPEVSPNSETKVSRNTDGTLVLRNTNGTLGLGYQLLEMAKEYKKLGWLWESKMLAGRSIGFIGFGGPISDLPRLLPQNSKEWKQASEILSSYPHVVPVWQNHLAAKSVDHSIIIQIQAEYSNFVHTLAFNPDSTILASDSADTKSIKLWNVADGKLLKSLEGHANYVTSIAFSPDGKTIASGSADKTIRIWDVQNSTECLCLRGHSSRVTSVAFSPDGKTIASGSADTAIKIWSVEDGTELLCLKGHSSRVTSVAFSPDGKTIASGSEDTTVRIWNVENGTELLCLKGHFSDVNTIAFSPDGKTLASGSSDTTIKIWDVEKGTQRLYLKDDSSEINCIAFSPDGKIIASCHYDTIRLWDLEHGSLILTLFEGFGGITCVGFSPDGQYLVCGTSKNCIKLYKYEREHISLEADDCLDSVFTLAFSPDSKIVAYGSINAVSLWNAANGKCLKLLQDIDGLVYSLAFSSDGKILAFNTAFGSEEDRNIKLWDISTGSLKSLEGNNDTTFCLAFNPCYENILASGGNDKIVKLWDAFSGKLFQSLEGHEDIISTVAFSPDGNTLASGSNDKTIKLWDVFTGKLLKSLKGHSCGVKSLVFSPDGQTIASSGYMSDREANAEDSIKLWDVNTGKQNDVVFHYSDNVFSLVFSPDGQVLASAGKEKNITLWDTFTGTPVKSDLVRSLKQNGDKVLTGVFSPDGKKFASGGSSTINIWNLECPPYGDYVKKWVKFDKLDVFWKDAEDDKWKYNKDLQLFLLNSKKNY